MTLGSIVVRLSMQTADFETDAGRAAKVAERRAKEIDGAFRKAGLVIGAALGTAAVGIGKAVASAIDAADRVGELSQRLGVSTEKLSAWGYAAGQSGTDLDALTGGLTRFTKAVSTAAEGTNRQSEIFAELGVSLTDAAGELRSVESLVPEVAQAFREMDNATQEAAYAQELFGRSGADLLQFLNLGKTGLQGMEDRARELGIVLSERTAKAAGEFNDKLDDLKTLAHGAGLQLAEQLLPALDKVVSAFSDGLEDGGGLQKLIGWIGDEADAAAKDLEFMAGTVRDLTNMFGGLADGASATLGVLQGIATLDWGKVRQSIREGMEADQRIADGFLSRDPVMRQGPAPSTGLEQFFPIPGTEAPWSAVPATPIAQGRRSPAPPTSGGGGRGSGGSRSLRELPDFARDAAAELRDLVEAEAAARESFEALEAQLGGPLTEAAHAYRTEQAQLNELAKAGAVDSARLEAAQTNLTARYEEQVAAINAQLTPAQEVIAGLQEEIQLLGMNEVAQMKLVAARMAGANATAEEVAEIGRLIEAREEARKEAALWEGVETGLSDAIFDLTQNIGDAENILKDFADSIAAMITRSLAEDWAGKITDWFRGGSSSQSSSGNSGWASLFGAFFGGGTESTYGESMGSIADLFGGSWGYSRGGFTGYGGVMEPAGLVHRGEVVWSQGDVARAGGVSAVESMRRGGGLRDVRLSQTFVVRGTPDRRTAEQMARDSGRAARRAMARSGA